MKKIGTSLPQKQAFNTIYSYIEEREGAGVIRAIEPYYIKAWVKTRLEPKHGIEIYIREMNHGSQIEIERFITDEMIVDLAVILIIIITLAPFVSLISCTVIYHMPFDFYVMVTVYVNVGLSSIILTFITLWVPRFVSKFMAEIERLVSSSTVVNDG